MKALLSLLLLFSTMGVASAIDIPPSLNWNKKQAGDIVVGALKKPPRAIDLAQLTSPDGLDTRNLHKRVMAHPVFRKGDFATNFLEKHLFNTTNGKDKH